MGAVAEDFALNDATLVYEPKYDGGFDLADIYQMFGDSPLQAQPEALEKLSEQLRQAKETFEEIASKTNTRDDTDFYAVVVFRAHEDRIAFTEALQLPDNRFVDGRFLTTILVNKRAEVVEKPSDGTALGTGHN